MTPLPIPLPPVLTVHCFGDELLSLIHQLKAINSADHSHSSISLLRRGHSQSHWIADVFTDHPILKQLDLLSTKQ